MTGDAHVKIGFIPLVDAAALLIATEKRFAREEGLDVELIREASWANVRDKLAIGRFDAAHLLAPMAVACTLGLGHVRVPLVAPINLAMNGNAITVSTALYAELAAEDEVAHPAQTARALAKLVARRRAEGQEPLTFGMTFPFSTHNYQLRYWMAEGGIDPVSVGRGQLPSAIPVAQKFTEFGFLHISRPLLYGFPSPTSHCSGANQHPIPLISDTAGRISMPMRSIVTAGSQTAFAAAMSGTQIPS